MGSLFLVMLYRKGKEMPNNFQVLYHDIPDKFYGLHIVHLDDAGNIEAIVSAPIITADSPEEIEREIKQMMVDVKKPLLKLSMYVEDINEHR